MGSHFPSVPTPLRSLLAIALAVAIGALSTACQRPAEPFMYDASGLPKSYKRIERDMTRQFTTHWTRQAYYKPSLKKLAKAGPPKDVIFQQWGAPDWVRHFRSIGDQKVEEWLYLSKATIFQFQGGEMVYTGPLTDLEQILLNRGYPDRIEFVRNNLDNREYQLFYMGLFQQNLEQFNLFNDKIVTSIQGN